LRVAFVACVYYCGWFNIIAHKIIY
jgi:hypothetical protein